MGDVRIPKQRRSIAKKLEIEKAGFLLFCEKGYHGTNTMEIAERAGVSIGALYSYFRDKREIYIAALKQYLQLRSAQLLGELSDLRDSLNLRDFIEKWIAAYTNIFAGTNQVLAQLRVLMLEDQEINSNFCELELQYVSAITALLEQKGLENDNVQEKAYAACALVDLLSREEAAFAHRGLDFNVLRTQITNTIFDLLSAG